MLSAATHLSDAAGMRFRDGDARRVATRVCSESPGLLADEPGRSGHGSAFSKFSCQNNTLAAPK